MENLSKKLGEEWEKEKVKERPSFTKALSRTFFSQFISSIFLLTIKHGSMPVLSVVVGLLVDALDSGDEEEYMLYVYFALIFFLLIVPSLAFAQAFFHSVNVGTAMKGV